MPRPSADFVVRVKTRRPWRRVVIVALGIAGVVGGGWGSYEYGRYRSGYDGTADARELVQVRGYVKQLEDRNKQLRDRAAMLQQGSKVDQYAYKDVSKSLKGLQDEIYELKEEVAFYRTILEPGDTGKGLRIQSLKVQRDGQRNRYRYKLVLTQVLTRAQTVHGDVQVTIYGRRGADQGVLTLGDVTADKDKEIHFRFKYFQKLQGVMTFPDGFTPTRVALRVMPGGKAKQAVEKTFNWSEIGA